MNILLHKQTIQGRKISTAINYSTNYTTAKTRLIHYSKGQQNLKARDAFCPWHAKKKSVMLSVSTKINHTISWPEEDWDVWLISWYCFPGISKTKEFLWVVNQHFYTFAISTVNTKRRYLMHETFFVAIRNCYINHRKKGVGTVCCFPIMVN